MAFDGFIGLMKNSNSSARTRASGSKIGGGRNSLAKGRSDLSANWHLLARYIGDVLELRTKMLGLAVLASQGGGKQNTFYSLRQQAIGEGRRRVLNHQISTQTGASRF